MLTNNNYTHMTSLSGLSSRVEPQQHPTIITITLFTAATTGNNGDSGISCAIFSTMGIPRTIALIIGRRPHEQFFQQFQQFRAHPVERQFSPGQKILTPIQTLLPAKQSGFFDWRALNQINQFHILIEFYEKVYFHIR